MRQTLSSAIAPQVRLNFLLQNQDPDSSTAKIHSTARAQTTRLKLTISLYFKRRWKARYRSRAIVAIVASGTESTKDDILQYVMAIEQ